MLRVVFLISLKALERLVYMILLNNAAYFIVSVSRCLKCCGQSVATKGMRRVFAVEAGRYNPGSLPSSSRQLQRSARSRFLKGISLTGRSHSSSA